MEDAATAEIARVQLWQWVKYGCKTVSSSCVLQGQGADIQDSGKKIDAAFLQPIFSEESAKVSALPGYSRSDVKIASEYLIGDIKSQWPADFLTSDLSRYLDAERAPSSQKSSL
jgi:malate synthase